MVDENGTYLQMVMDMEESERTLFYQAETVVEQKMWLEQMLATNKALDVSSQEMASIAEGYLLNYKMFQDKPDADEFLQSAEFYQQMAVNLRQSKYRIKDIRNQRKAIQWETRKMKELRKTTELKPSLKDSSNLSPSS